MSNYWEAEKPQTADTGRNVLRWFQKAGKLQVAMPNWKDKDGQQKPGKTVTLDLEAVQLNPGAVDILRRVVAEMKA